MKYMGSKSRIKKYIVPILQKIIDDNNYPVNILMTILWIRRI